MNLLRAFNIIFIFVLSFLAIHPLSAQQCGTGTQVGSGVVTPYWREQNGEAEGVPIPDGTSRNRYALINVIRGVQYEINARFIMVCNGTQEIPLSDSDGSTFSNPKKNFIAPISGQVRVYYTRFWGSGSDMRIKIIGGANNIDNQNSYNSNNKWRTHFYREMNNFTNYLGYKDYNSHSFDEQRDPSGNSTPIEVRSQGAMRAGILRYFSARSLMKNTSLKGFYYVKLGSDDGTRLFINDEKVYDRWNPAEDYFVKTQVIKLTGNNDQLKYEYFNNNIPLRYIFQIDPTADKIIENTNLTSSNGTKICMGSSTTLDGDDFAAALPNTFTNPTFQWHYATSPTGTKHPIIGGNTRHYVVNTNVPPFNNPAGGSYYFFREAKITINNIGVPSKPESIMSAPIQIDVIKKLNVNVKPNKKSFCQGESGAEIQVQIANPAQPPFVFTYKINGVEYQHTSNVRNFNIPINTNQAGTLEYEYVSVTDGYGCTTQIHQADNITIKPLPIAVFSGQNTTVCLNTSQAQIPWVTFTGELPFTVKIRAGKTGETPIEIEVPLAENENSLTMGHNPNDEGEFIYELLWVSDKNGCKTFFNNQKLVVNVVKPSITLTTPENITLCLPDVVTAVYDEGSGNTNVAENSYVLPSGDTTLDVTINPVPCCPNPVLKWTINNNLGNVRTGQPSTFAGEIAFENATSTDKTYNITYWLECNGQKYNYVTREVRITPRPVLQFE
ncbi:hypothetical protein [Capnocytophaga canis]|uniref:hypothetical protein n=1 Tax=Capnocytophaga canis TaxID=1848903 RepID=UPI0015622AAB|nr:hypothetical protein [Capnocytophaga canis]